MRWEYSMSLYLDKHCIARGLRPKTIHAYQETLKQFREYMETKLEKAAPERVKTRDVLEYIEHLRVERNNKSAAVTRTVTILRMFYRALVAMDYMDVCDNPMAGFPKIKKPELKFRETLTENEVGKLINMPRTDTVLGIRDRALMVLLCGSGIRSSECAHLKEKDVKLEEKMIHVTGKGGNQRTVPLNDEMVQILRQYKQVRGTVERDATFFRSRRKGKGLSRHAIYERVRTYKTRARIKKIVSPHTLRHSFATFLLRKGVNLVVLRDLLGHRSLSSTQIYMHMTAQDIRKAIDQHPIRKLVNKIKHFLPEQILAFQYPPGTRFAFSTERR
jgi:integrase/recombinase XerD